MSDIFDLFRLLEKDKGAKKSSPVTHIVAGLGNPGDKYHFNRHNVGFLALDCIEQKLNFKMRKIKFKSLCEDVTVGGARILFIRPQTFMNNSGEAVKAAADFYKIPSKNVIVIYDDVSLPTGKMRLRVKGSAGGHNGIKSIIAQLETNEFSRIKIGIGAPPDGDMISWVLGDIPKEDQEAIFNCIMNVLPCIELIVDGKIDQAMNMYN